MEQHIREAFMNTGQNSGNISYNELALIEKIRVLPPDRVHEVEDFVDFLRLADEDRRLIREAAKLSENAFSAVWDNPEDAVYDRL
jgi:hypothetical protein